MCLLRVCVIHVFAYQHSRGVNGWESPVALGPTLNETPARRSAPVESRTGPISGRICDGRAGRCISRDPVTLRQPRHLIHHARGRPAASARAWLVVPDAKRGTYRSVPYTAGAATVFRERHSRRTPLSRP